MNSFQAKDTSLIEITSNTPDFYSEHVIPINEDQFNNNYLLNGGMNLVQHGSVIPMSYGSIAFASINTNYAQDPPPQTLGVTHLGTDGGIIYNT